MASRRPSPGHTGPVHRRRQRSPSLPPSRRQPRRRSEVSGSQPRGHVAGDSLASPSEASPAPPRQSLLRKRSYVTTSAPRLPSPPGHGSLRAGSPQPPRRLPPCRPRHLLLVTPAPSSPSWSGRSRDQRDRVEGMKGNAQGEVIKDTVGPARPSLGPRVLGTAGCLPPEQQQAWAWPPRVAPSWTCSSIRQVPEATVLVALCPQ